MTVSRPVAYLVGALAVPVAYAIQAAVGRLLDWWTKPRPPRT